MTRKALICGAALAVATAACGSGGDPGAAEGTGDLALAASAAAEGGPVVAKVDGSPIRAGCVRAQAAERGLDRREALSRCVEFRLLENRAHGKGYGSRPAARRSYRDELARALIQEDFEADFSDPSDVPRSDLEALWPRVRGRFDHPGVRFVTYVRAPAGPGPGTDDDGGKHRAQRELASDIHEALGHYTNLEAERFFRLALDIADERELELGEPVGISADAEEVDPALSDAAFAIPAVGMISEPIRTEDGWDVVLLTQDEPKTRKSFEEALPALREIVFDEARRDAFSAWAAALRDRADVEVFPENFELVGTSAAGPGAAQ